jgi:hypothetical protein
MKLKKLVGLCRFYRIYSEPCRAPLPEALALASSASAALPMPSMVLEQSNSSTVKKKSKKKTSTTVSASPLEKRTYFDRIDLKSVLEGLHDRMYVQEMFL